jgi:threonine/homoserine/homoserine lactone efflux protein
VRAFRVRHTLRMFVHFEAFLAIALLISVAPGPDTALATQNALVGGRQAAVFTVLGVALGLAVWTIAASVGRAAGARAIALGRAG